MTNRQSSATDRAISLILAGTHTRYSAARECGLSLSTVYRAWARHLKSITKGKP
jgi:transposase